jgi:hypothetical protein
MSDPVRHHIVPQFYLERFEEGGAFKLVDRNNHGRSFPSNARHALAENDFYTVDTDEGRDTVVETMFSEHVEGPAATAVRRLVEEGRSLGGPGLRGPISLFLAFQWVRGPAWRNMMVEHSKASTRMLMSLAKPSDVVRTLQARGEEITAEEAAEIAADARGGNYDLVVERAANLHLGVALKAAVRLAPRLDARTWSIVEFDEPVLATCDDPVLLVGKDPLSPGEAGGIDGALRVVVPLDPRHALVMARPDVSAEQLRRRGNVDDARVINLHVAFHAHRFIVRTPGTNPLEGIVAPKKAPSVFVLRDMVIMQMHASEKRRAEYLAKVARGEIRFRVAPEDDEDDEPEAA